MIVGLVYAGVGTLGVVSGGAWAGFGIGGALLLALIWGLRNRRFPLPDRVATLFVGLVLALAALSTFAAVDPVLARHAVLKLVTLLVPLLFLSAAPIKEAGQRMLRHIPVLLLLVMASVVVLCVLLERAITTYGPDAGEVTKLNRGFTYLLMLAWPLWAFIALGQQKRRLDWVLLIGGPLFLGAGLWLTHSRAAQMGVTLAVATFVAAWLLPRVTAAALGGVGLLFLGWPFAAQYAFKAYHNAVAVLPDSWYHRAEIWDYLSYRIAERPWSGWGIGNAHKLDWLIPHGAMYEAVAVEASHPHNVIVQLWVELGVAGLSVFVFLAVWALYGIFRLPAKLRPFALACMTFVICLLLCAYNFWTDSLWASMALTAYAFCLIGREKLSHS